MKPILSFLVAVAVVLSSLSARADRPAYRMAVPDSPSQATTQLWLPESLEAIYQYDDGTTESYIIAALNGSVDQPEAIYVEHFDVIPGQNLIDSIAVAWGSDVGTNPDGLNGQPVTLGIWSDPDNDGQPYDAVLLGWVDGSVSFANTDTFVTYKFKRPVAIADGGSFFLGFKTPAIRRAFADNKGHSFAGLDTTSSAGQGWMIWNDPRPKVNLRRLGDNAFIFQLDALLGPSNFMIRSGF